MKARRGNPGLKGRLLDKSVDAYVLSLEMINRLSVQYRLESFCYLICNAWELLLKAKILDSTGNNLDAIYRGKKKRGERRESLSLRVCLDRVIPNHTDPERRNLEKIAELRDEATHLVISEIPLEVMCLFQACVINYHRRLNGWFNISLSDRVPVGMMSIVYDLEPHRTAITDKRLCRRLGKDAADFLSRYSAEIRKEFDDLQRPAQFSIGIDYSLVLTQKPSDADIVLSKGAFGDTVLQMVEVPKDPSKSHPFRQKEIVETVKSAIPSIMINPHDIQCVIKLHEIKRRPEYFYQGKVKGSPAQYSQGFVDWLVQQYHKDNTFFQKSRIAVKERK